MFRAGEQEQTPPEGFESSGSETVLGTEVKYDTPITRTITSANIDRLRFTFGVQALVETTSKGDRNPSEVRLLVQIQRNGGWVTEKDITIKGKTTSQYLASVVVDNLPPRPFSIRMRRMTPDSTTDRLQNKTLWSSYTEIIDVKQCYSLIIMPDMTRYAGDGAGIKAITGGDKVAIDPKHKAPYSTRVPAVVLAVNNYAMSFSDRSGGISRRRVIFNFSEVVPENERDPMLAKKIEGELAVVIRHLLTRFADQDEAKRLLYEQQKSEEALLIKREGDSLVDFCGYLMSLVKCEGMIVGNAEIVPFSPRRYLYHAYLAYMSAHGLGKPVSLTRFGTDMPGAMAEYGKEYKRAKCTKGPDKGRTITNVLLDKDADGWLPATAGINDRT